MKKKQEDKKESTRASGRTLRFTHF